MKLEERKKHDLEYFQIIERGLVELKYLSLKRFEIGLTVERKKELFFAMRDCAAKIINSVSDIERNRDYVKGEELFNWPDL